MMVRLARMIHKYASTALPWLTWWPLDHDECNACRIVEGERAGGEGKDLMDDDAGEDIYLTLSLPL